MTTRRGSKRKGTDYEREVRKALEAAGYDVMRSAASKGLFDLFAYSGTQAILLQAKDDGRGCLSAVTLALSLRKRDQVPAWVQIAVVHPAAGGLRMCHHVS